jgi:glyoxylase-like metal-dependent hydrolase (beta-lactamase superfamily II)
VAVDEAVIVCTTCGANYGPDQALPDVCAICADERQWVPPSGQEWRTLGELGAGGHHSDVREIEPGLHGIGTKPGLAIGQRGLLVRTDAGNVLWDPSPFIDDAAVDAVRALGGVRALASSHPHMYGSIVEWSHAFEAEICLAEADLAWLARPDPAVRPWSGALEVVPGVTLVQCGGHFPGSSVLLWSAGAGGRGALLCGDTLFVTPGEDRVSFLYSAPNRLPLPEQEVRGVVEALAPYAFDRMYGAWWTPVLREGAQSVLARSAARYIEVLQGHIADGGSR